MRRSLQEKASYIVLPGRPTRQDLARPLQLSLRARFSRNLAGAWLQPVVQYVAASFQYNEDQVERSGQILPLLAAKNICLDIVNGLCRACGYYGQKVRYRRCDRTLRQKKPRYKGRRSSAAITLPKPIVPKISSCNMPTTRVSLPDDLI